MTLWVTYVACLSAIITVNVLIVFPSVGHTLKSTEAFRSNLKYFPRTFTHLPLVPPIYASVNWVSICSDNGLSPIRRQVIIWTNAGLLSIGPLGTKFSEILIKIQNFSLAKMHLNISSAKWRPFCPGGDELTKQSVCMLNVWMAGLVLNILRMQSRSNMGYTANMIIKDIIKIFASISKNMLSLLMGQHLSQALNGIERT